MRIGTWSRLLLAATPFLAFLLTGCGNFWQAPGGGSSSFTLSNGGNILVSPGASSGNTSLITVTAGSSFTGTVTLGCAVTTSMSSATDPTCGLSSTSVATSGTSTLTVTTTSSTTVGLYTVTVTGTSGSISKTTSVCVDVTTSTTNSCTSTAAKSGDFYILNGGTSGSITEYYVNSSGLNKVGSSVSLTGVLPVAMAVAPNGKFLMVSTSSSGVFAYPITNGVVGSTAVQVTQDLASSIQIDSTDSWLVEAVPSVGSFTIYAVPINSTTGAFTQTTIYHLGISAPNAALPNGQMVISGDNKNIFVALGTGGTAVVPFNTANANPLPSTAASAILIGVDHTGGSALSVAVDPGTTPRLFYIGEVLGNTAGNAGGLRAFTYASLSTTPITLVLADGSPIASGALAPSFILPVASGNYVYVADKAGSITGFAITAASGPTYTISAGSTVSAGDQPLGMAEDSTGAYVFEVGSSGSPYFDAYTLNASTGQLTSQVTSTSQATSIAMVAAP